MSDLPPGARRYLVGGSVRDRLLGRPAADRDFLVVGASASDLIALGYQPVGHHFTVFLHPESREEHALPQAPGGRSGAGVTVEEDLARRDLTINAMALSDDGDLIDPFGGLQDMSNRVLRHVGPAFAEDPLRVLRVARFAAELDFAVAPETLALMHELAPRLSRLPRERIWQEVRRVMASASPCHFVLTLRDCDALAHLIPELDRLFGVPQPAEHHPEIDTGEHVLLALQVATTLTDDPQVRFAVLLHDLGKGLTPVGMLPQHIGHEETGAPLVHSVCERLGAPNVYRRLAEAVCRHHLRANRAMESRPATRLALLDAIGAFRNEVAFERFLLACEADARGRLGREDAPYPQARRLRRDRAAALAVDLHRAEACPNPAAWVRERRVEAIRRADCRSREINQSSDE
jgi:tRNA nucleotidyltransferase (CCA-adding enzyme)